MMSVVERLRSMNEDLLELVDRELSMREPCDVPARELARDTERVIIRVLSAPGVWARDICRARREKSGPIGRTLAATMPKFCSRLLRSRHVSLRSETWYQRGLLTLQRLVR